MTAHRPEYAALIEAAAAALEYFDDQLADDPTCEWVGEIAPLLRAVLKGNA